MATQAHGPPGDGSLARATNISEPEQTSLDLNGRILRIGFRIHPLFWASLALLGIRYLADPEAGSLGYFFFWIGAGLISVMISALAQARLGRLFGMQGRIVLTGLGSFLLELEQLRRCWQRIVLLFIGPMVSGLLVAAVLLVIWLVPFWAPDDWGSAIATCMYIFVRINLYWGLLNLLPIWPLAGGRIAAELGGCLLGLRGRTIAAILSLVVIGGICIGVVIQMAWHLELVFDPRYILHLFESSILLLFCYLLWMRNIKELWPSH